jgi:hypothetical protein
MARLRSVQREVLHLMCKVMLVCVCMRICIWPFRCFVAGKDTGENWREKRGSKPICDPFPRVGGWLGREKREGEREIEGRFGF